VAQSFSSEATANGSTFFSVQRFGTCFRHSVEGIFELYSIRLHVFPFSTTTMNKATCLKLLSPAHTPEKGCGAVGMENTVKLAVPSERMVRFLEENDPYHFQVGGTAVTVSFGGEMPFQDALVKALNAS